jgi:hypothetical protein
MRLVVNIENGSSVGKCGTTDFLEDPLIFGKDSIAHKGLIEELQRLEIRVRECRILLETVSV